MQPLVVITARVLRHSYEEHCAVGAVGSVDYRGVGDTDLRRNLPASMVVTGRLVGAQSRDLPQLRTRVRIESKGACIFSNCDEHIMRLPGDGEAAHIQRLPV